jgi:hypothetical protein
MSDCIRGECVEVLISPSAEKLDRRRVHIKSSGFDALRAVIIAGITGRMSSVYPASNSIEMTEKGRRWEFTQLNNFSEPFRSTIGY